MSADKDGKRPKKMLITMLALLSVYAVITLAMAVMFEYYTVSTSGGSIIFSLSMSWQVILFAAEFITIIVQIVFLFKVLKSKKVKDYKTILYTGIIAAAVVIATDAVVGFFQGFSVNPAAVFLVYGLLIAAVRAMLLPIVVKRYICP